MTLKSGKSLFMALRPDTSIQYIKGVGPKLGALFSRNGIKTVLDLLNFYPRAYEDQRAMRSIDSLRPNDIVSIKARVVNVHAINLGRSKRKMYDVILGDASGRIHCKYFRVPYKGYFERLTLNKEVRVVGKVIEYRGRIEFHHPDIRDVESDEAVSDTLIPLYTEIEGLSTTKIQKLIRFCLSQIDEEFWPPEIIPDWVKKKYGLISKKEALAQIHIPNMNFAKEYLESRSPSHKRLIFEEFFWLELILATRRAGFKKEKAPAILAEGRKVAQLCAGLPFKLTNAQVRVFDEIKKDLEKPSPMHRLVQGDVGSGKTLVSFMSALLAIETGFQVCIMAPTEILAEQHYNNAIKLLSNFGINTQLLTGRMKASEKRNVLSDLGEGKINLLVGTHALIEDDVKFANLGLVVIDEQHRFGVEQRLKLKSKGKSPHFLVMTATPIPRTLAMTVYGDLDVSVVDEMPPGRSPIQTRVIYESKRPQALQFLKEQILKGRQAYLIYPLVEESEKIDLKNAVDEHQKLVATFPEFKVGLLHGKMKSDEKDQIMDQFRKNEIQILVSTTVIEVGVDVSNANIMIIEHAERFGLSQLHQLRGRVGRGEHKSFCILILGYSVSEESLERTGMMEKSSDGFRIAEFDLEMRGPGEFMGTRQSGLPGFKMAHLIRDMQILQQAREAAFEILKNDPNLIRSEHQQVKSEVLQSPGPIG